MINTRAMPTQQTAITGVSRRITAGQQIKAGLCRDPGEVAVESCDPNIAEYVDGQLAHVHLWGFQHTEHCPLAGRVRGGVFAWRTILERRELRAVEVERLQGLEVASCRCRPDLVEATPDRGLFLRVAPVDHVSVVIVTMASSAGTTAMP